MLRATQVVAPRLAKSCFVLCGGLQTARRPAFLIHRHAQPTSPRLATSPSRVAQALHPFGLRTSATARKAARSGGWLALRAAVLRRALRDTRRCAARPRRRHRSAFERCIRPAVSVRSQPMQEARAQFHSPSVLVQRRPKPRANPSIERTRSGRPHLAFISFWAKCVLPPRAAQRKR